MVSSKFRRILLLLICICSLVLFCPACSSSNDKGLLSDKIKRKSAITSSAKYIFKLNLKIGKTYKYKLAGMQSVIVPINNSEQKIPGNGFEYIQRWIIKKHIDDKYFIRIINDEIKYTSHSKSQNKNATEFTNEILRALKGMEMNLTINAEGEVLDAHMPENIFDFLAEKMKIEDPNFKKTMQTIGKHMSRETKDQYNQMLNFTNGEKVQVGDKWNNTFEFKLMNNQAINLSLEYKFDKLGLIKGNQLAYIDFIGKKKFPHGLDLLKNLDDKTPSLRETMSSMILWDLIISGTVIFNCKEKAIQEIEQKIVSAMDTKKAGMFTSQKIKIETNYTMTLMGIK